MDNKAIALIDLSGHLSLPRLQAITAAIERQMQRDVAKVWAVGANIKAYAALSQVPADAWLVSIMEDIEEAQGINGIHWYKTDASGQKKAYAKVRYTDWQSLDFFETKLTKVISEEIIEMCIDPFGENKRIGNDPENPKAQKVNFLVEIGDPVQNLDIGYYIDEVFVSNFIYPAYFNLSHLEGTQYDHLGLLERPYSLAEGGYQIFERAGQWYQAWKIKGKLYYLQQGEALPSQGIPPLLYWLFGALLLLWLGLIGYKSYLKTLHSNG